MKCATCGGAVDVKHPGTLYEVRGWERVRAQGGQNHVIDRQRTGGVMCHGCAGRVRAGLNPGQGALT